MILVGGATGSIGRHLVRELRASGAPFRALVRDEGRGAELGCDFVVGDYDSPVSIEAALEGVDRLFLNAGGAVPSDGAQPMVRQQVGAIKAAVAAGVESIVKVSVWGARRGGKLAEGAHWEIEQHLKAAPVAWSLLQPSGFMQNFVTGAGGLTSPDGLRGPAGDWRVSYIDAYDIARCAAALLTATPPEIGGVHVLTGPEALTQAEIAAKLSAAFGRPVPSRELTAAAMVAELTAQGLPTPFAADIVDLWGAVTGGSLSTTTSAVRDLTGRDPRTFDEFLASRPTLRRPPPHLTPCRRQARSNTARRHARPSAARQITLVATRDSTPPPPRRPIAASPTPDLSPQAPRPTQRRTPLRPDPAAPDAAPGPAHPAVTDDYRRLATAETRPGLGGACFVTAVAIGRVGPHADRSPNRRPAAALSIASGLRTFGQVGRTFKTAI
ncbi:NmrA family NAD(P)-binding protein [Paractinoplanes lichenicola]|uniref:NmrA family NAD(P)-binding protein n=1 Tax=Paractinoplanes lichenicola TaxID=2802976 RepID=A0ABS1VEP2_9ACTN|nr:NmrA family NAD(P)-binding protein [Actinoplanes lichenicola]MBL7253143.1 NmrA family NAD(P)-binding protein [Actinoplanes lichenicola]